MDIRTSPLVHDALEGKRQTRWWLAWPLVVLVFIIVPQAIFGSLDPFAAGSYGAQWFELVTNATSVLLLFLWLHFWERRPFSSVGFRYGHAARRFFIGLLGGFAAMAGSALVLVALGKYDFSGSEHVTTGVSAMLPVLAVMLVWLVQGSTEEILMRGYLLPVSGNQMPGWLAIFLVSFGFAAIHMNFEPLVLANITLVAVFFSFISLAQGSIWAACGFHVGWNAMQGSILGIPVSGNAYAVSLFTFGPAADAPTWLTGGEFGVEGSAVATVVLVVLAIWSYRYFRKATERRLAGAEAVTSPATAVEASAGA